MVNGDRNDDGLRRLVLQCYRSTVRRSHSRTDALLSTVALYLMCPVYQNREASDAD